MSRKLVFVGVFLTTLLALIVCVKAQGADPSKKTLGDTVDPFGSAGVAKSDKSKPPSKPKAADNPFDDTVVAKPDESKPPRKAKDAGNPFDDAAVAKPDGLKPSSKPKLDLTKPKLYSGAKLHGGEKAILKVLKQETSLDFVQTPLKDVLDYLSEKHQIPICMDLPALKEVRVDESTPITCKLSSIPLRSALEIILDELQLKWGIRHDVLMIISSTKAESDEYLCTKWYDLTDLLATSKDQELQNPLAQFKEGDYQGVQSTQFGGGMVNGVKNGRLVCDELEQRSADIRSILTTCVATKTWEEHGGSGTICDYDRKLAITQTREVHMQIEQFLADFRARWRAEPTFSVELHWLWLDAKQRDRLLTGHAKSSYGQLSLPVSSQRLLQIARDVPGIHGQVVCMNGIGTAIAAGDRRSIIFDTIPVFLDAVSYRPIISVPNVGVTAQIRPKLVPGTKTAMLDITSIVTRWDPSRKPAIISAAWPVDKQVRASNPRSIPLPAKHAAKPTPAKTPPAVTPSVRTRSTQAASASCPIDQPVMPTQQISTTLRVPLGKPVIVGSMTFASAGDAGLGAAKKNAVEVYLIVTTSIVRGEQK